MKTNTTRHIMAAALCAAALLAPLANAATWTYNPAAGTLTHATTP